MNKVTADLKEKSEEFWRHPFPVIDFRFQNTGQASALLTKFVIIIDEMKIDPTPDLQFSWALRSQPDGCNSLSVSGRNFGWGSAKELVLDFEGELPQLFPRTVQMCHEIKDDDPEELYEFLPQDIDTNSLSKLEAADEFFPINSDLSGVSKDAEWKRLSQAKFSWSCSDEESRPHEGNDVLDWERSDEMLFVSESGFKTSPMMSRCGAAAPPGPTFCAILDADQPDTQKEYSLSRVIEAGGWERFQILIGATKSCRTRVRVGFYANNKELVNSDPIDIRITNNRRSQHHLRYFDGQEIFAKSTEEMEDNNRAVEIPAFLRRQAN